VLDGALNIRDVETLRRRLLDAVAENASPRVDCTGADTVDLSFIQLLLAARHSAHRLGKQLSLAAPAGGALRAALEQGGFVPPGEACGDPFWSGE
jgi:anti-anti-sigma regulatory factor